MSEFEWIEPATLSEIKTALSSGDPNTRIVSGGTALSLIMRQGMFNPEKLISMKKVKTVLDFIKEDEESIRIGAMTSLDSIEKSLIVRRIAPVISKALKHVANPRIRYVASIGGNLAHGDAHLDLPPILLAMNAKVKIESSEAKRWINIKDLYKGYYVTDIGPNEILTEVLIPKQNNKFKGTYLKFTTLSNDDWPTVGIAVFLEEKERITSDVRIVVSAATEVPTRLEEVEQVIINNELSEKVIKKAADKAFEVVEPLEDLRGTEWYKKEMVRVHVSRGLKEFL